MESKTKIRWMKVFLVLYIFCEVAGLYAVVKTENKLVLIFFVAASLIVSMPVLYFAVKIDSQPWSLRVKPSIKMLNVSCFEDFKNQLFQDAKQEGFCDMQIVESDNNMETVLAFKREKSELTILQTFWMDEFDEEILGKMTELFWEETEKKIGKRKIQNYVVRLIQCICVRRLNEQANEFVHRNLLQNVRQYQSLNVISFDERMVYICQTNYKVFDKEFKRVENLFLKITEKLLS